VGRATEEEVLRLRKQRVRVCCCAGGAVRLAAHEIEQKCFPLCRLHPDAWWEEAVFAAVRELCQTAPAIQAIAPWNDRQRNATHVIARFERTIQRLHAA
jgi:hypothetical protein